MTSLDSPRFPRSNANDPAWLTENPMGAVMKRAFGKPLAEYAWPSTLRSEPTRYERRPVLR